MHHQQETTMCVHSCAIIWIDGNASFVTTVVTGSRDMYWLEEEQVGYLSPIQSLIGWRILRFDYQPCTPMQMPPNLVSWTKLTAHVASVYRAHLLYWRQLWRNNVTFFQVPCTLLRVLILASMAAAHLKITIAKMEVSSVARYPVVFLRSITTPSKHRVCSETQLEATSHEAVAVYSTRHKLV